MNALEGAGHLIIVIQQALKVVEDLARVACKLRSAARQPSFSYENLSLHLTLEIKDARGKHATVRRRQRVHFLSSEAGVLTNPTWGRGKQVDRLVVAGAKHVGSRFEGHREVLMLGLAERPAKDSVATVTSERAIAEGYMKEREYFEAAIERPTRHLTLKVVFPRGRPPREALFIGDPGKQPRHVRARLDPQGRAILSLSARHIPAGKSYSLRWSW